jgi:molybdopterin converting factor small subunit
MAEENQVEEQDTDGGVEVELDAPETTEEQEAPVAVQEEEAPQEAAAQSDELDDYGAKVQARIKKLTEKYRKEERDREEAVRMAQQLMAENQKLKGQMHNLDRGYLAEYGQRLESQEAAVKNAYKQAYENGDTDAMFQAQEALSRIAVEKDKYTLARARAERQQVAPQEQPQQQYQQPQRQQVAAPQPDPKAQSWAEKNDWFGTDEVMTYAAFGIHRRLVEEEGFDPESDEYYNEVDKRIRSEFPQKFQTAKKSGGAQVAPAAASASRSNKSGRRSVKLSPSQIAMAKRLNVPLEEYARYVKD